MILQTVSTTDRQHRMSLLTAESDVLLGTHQTKTNLSFDDKRLTCCCVPSGNLQAQLASVSIHSLRSPSDHHACMDPNTTFKLVPHFSYAWMRSQQVKQKESIAGCGNKDHKDPATCTGLSSSMLVGIITSFVLKVHHRDLKRDFSCYKMQKIFSWKARKA